MSKWEETVKNRLEEYESPLPEGSFAEFFDRRNNASGNSRAKLTTWARVLVTAVAAVLAVMLFRRQPGSPIDDIQIIQQPENPVAATVDSSVVYEQSIIETTVIQLDDHKALMQAKVRQDTTEVLPDYTIEEPSQEEGDSNLAESQEEFGGISTDNNKEESIIIGIDTQSSPFIPNNTIRKPKGLSIVPAAGAVAGGGLLAAVITPLTGSRRNPSNIPIHGDPTPGEDPVGPGGVPVEPVDERTNDYLHRFPIQLGLSTRIPFSERLSFTTGFDYSLYSSTFTYTISGEKEQVVHYVGIPMRIDWTMASNKLIDVYFGGGIKGDYCLGATLEGKPIKKDGINFSLLGAGGIQFNVTKWLGVYVEPEISYTIPSRRLILETYRTEHPLVFSVASGIRINIGTTKSK